MLKKLATETRFYLHFGIVFALVRNIQAVVPQGSELAPLLVYIYHSDLPTNINTELALFADDNATYTSSKDVVTITNNIQTPLIRIHTWENIEN